MDEETYNKIKEWIFDNHEHHTGGARSTMTLNEDGTSTDWEDEEDDSNCIDGDNPYVNSMKLEEFVDSLVPKEYEHRYGVKTGKYSGGRASYSSRDNDGGSILGHDKLWNVGDVSDSTQIDADPPEPADPASTPLTQPPPKPRPQPTERYHKYA